MPVTNTWLNADGLYVKFGKTEGVSLQQGGYYCTDGPYSTAVINLDMTTLTSTATIIEDVLTLPMNGYLESVEIYTIEAAATGAAINIGIIGNDRATSTVVYTGSGGQVTTALANGTTATELNAIGNYLKYYKNVNIPAASTTGGIAFGKVLLLPVLITAMTTTGTAFTAGKLQVRLNFIPTGLTGYAQVHAG